MNLNDAAASVIGFPKNLERRVFLQHVEVFDTNFNGFSEPSPPQNVSSGVVRELGLNKGQVAGLAVSGLGRRAAIQA